MENNSLKNIVVLKNLPSNIVEEAIVVLKENKTKTQTKSKAQEVKPKQKEYILKEAEMVVTNYLSNMENKKCKNNKKIERNYKRLKIISICLIIAFVGLLIFKM